MGKRKLKFDVRKNHERKTVSYSASINNTRPQQPTELTQGMSGPVSVSDVCALHEQIIQSRRLPAEWTCSIVPASSMVLCKMAAQPTTSTSADIMHMVTICLDFTWTLRIGQNEVPLHESQLLCGLPYLLNSVESVVRVLSLLNVVLEILTKCDLVLEATASIVLPIG